MDIQSILNNDEIKVPPGIHQIMGWMNQSSMSSLDVDSGVGSMFLNWNNLERILADFGGLSTTQKHLLVDSVLYSTHKNDIAG